MEIIEKTDFTISDLNNNVKVLKEFLKEKWKFILKFSLIFSVIGLIYAFFQKPIYVAQANFVIESDESSKIGSISGLASQFGFDLGGSGSVFEGENLIELFKSNMIIKKHC